MRIRHTPGHNASPPPAIRRPVNSARRDPERSGTGATRWEPAPPRRALRLTSEIAEDTAHARTPGHEVWRQAVSHLPSDLPPSVQLG